MNSTQTATSERGNGTLAEASAMLPELGDLDREVRQWARERPLLTLGLAVLAGYVAGRILSRI